MSTKARRRAAMTTRTVVAGAALVISLGIPPESLARQAPATGSAPAVPEVRGAGAVESLFANRSLVATEEFEGSTLDATQWGAYNSPSSNGVSTFSPRQVRVAGGELQLIGEGRDPTGVGNTSGAVCWCNGIGNQAFGIFAIKAKLDPGKGYGPAMLLWPQSNRWPQDGEIDIIESVQPNRISDLASLHWGDPPRGERESGKIWGDFTDWRIYWVDWQPGYVKIYVDNYLVYDTTKSTKNPAIPATPMHVVVQQEPGPYAPETWLPAPDNTTPNQVIMHVDWVRIYR